MFENNWINFAALVGLLIGLLVGSMRLGVNSARDDVLRACAGKGDIVLESGALRVFIKCSVDRVGV